MSFTEEWKPPPNHPISLDRARELMVGDLGRVYCSIVIECVAPLYWHGITRDHKRVIYSNGTLTFVRTSERLLGVTAAHVLSAFHKVRNEPGIRCQLLDQCFDPKTIDESKALDLATVEITPELIANIGKKVTPVRMEESGNLPQEGRGILVCGYPGQDREETSELNVEWTPFPILGVARRVYEDQITLALESEYNVSTDDANTVSPNKDLGGISGGPLIALYETPSGVLHFSLAGVVVQASAELGNVVARRADFIRPDGTICKPNTSGARV